MIVENKHIAKNKPVENVDLASDIRPKLPKKADEECYGSGKFQKDRSFCEGSKNSEDVGDDTVREKASKLLWWKSTKFWLNVAMSVVVIAIGVSIGESVIDRQQSRGNSLSSAVLGGGNSTTSRSPTSSSTSPSSNLVSVPSSSPASVDIASSMPTLILSSSPSPKQIEEATSMTYFDYILSGTCICTNGITNALGEALVEAAIKEAPQSIYTVLESIKCTPNEICNLKKERRFLVNLESDGLSFTVALRQTAPPDLANTLQSSSDLLKKMTDDDFVIDTLNKNVGKTFEFTGANVLASPETSTTPSSEPSAGHSENPSSSPSFVPSELPSNMPSSVLSSAPSESPSSKPSNHPLSIPSAVPSSQPSTIPSSEPSAEPSELPSSVPSLSSTEENPFSIQRI